MESMEWHEDCFNNQKNYIQKLKEELQRIEDKIESLERDSKFYLLQIETAKKRKKSSFDSDRFLRKEKRL